MLFVPDGFITIEQAIQIAGENLFPDEWTGNETGQQSEDESPDDVSVSSSQGEQTATVRRLESVLKFLRNRLWEGKITAFKFTDDGQSSPLDQSIWASSRAEIIFQTGWLPPCPTLPAQLQWQSNGFPKHRVLVVKDDLHTSLPPMKVHATNVAENKCKKWLENQINEGPKSKKKDDYFQEAKKEIGKRLSHRAFCRQWASIVPPEWKNPGPRSKK
jgi:hypothetical protein